MGRDKSIKAPPEVVLHRDLSTNQQIVMLLGVCANMSTMLLNPASEAENIPGAKQVPREARQAAEVTFMKACDRLDQILDESARWGIDYQLRLEQQYNDRQAESLKLMAAQRAAEESRRLSADTVRAPNFRYRPMLVRVENGWAAFLGNPEDMESGILGLGGNPAEALASFDEAFNGKLSPAVTEWLKQHEDNVIHGVETVTPFPKEDNAKTLDETRGNGIDGAAGIGDASAGNLGGS